VTVPCSGKLIKGYSVFMGAKVLKKREINKKPRAFRSWLFTFLLLLGLKIALAYTTYWANPIIW
jgi:hypothetical protein